MRSPALFHARFSSRRRRREGKILVLLAITLPTLCGMIGLIVDGGLLLATSRQLQDVCDAAVTAAAIEKQSGKSNGEALAVAEQFVRTHNHLTSAVVSLNCPPAIGPYAGSQHHVELVLKLQFPTYFIHILGGSSLRDLSARSVAGFEASTDRSAVVVLEANPPQFSIAPVPAVPLSPTLPPVLGGLEVLGIGSVRIHGAVHVNNEWGGVDEHGEPVGEQSGAGGLSHAISATPVLNRTRLQASDIRVVGGVDDPSNYGSLDSGEPSPLQAGMLPVSDPFQNLPVPTIAADPQHVSDTIYGGVSVVQLPLLSPPVRLQPGVYDWIAITSGAVVFEPGVYIIRGTNPLTQLALSIVAGQVQADGVMFYITDAAEYSPISGSPDASDGQTAPLPGFGNLPPCAVINAGLLGSHFSGLDDPGSPFHGMLIYQRRHDRRPIVLLQENLIGEGQLSGTVYSKWGHVVLAGRGNYDLRLVTGTLRLIAITDMDIQPSTTLPPAYDVYLVE